jgi:hypothetical protein
MDARVKPAHDESIVLGTVPVCDAPLKKRCIASGTRNLHAMDNATPAP